MSSSESSSKSSSGSGQGRGSGSRNRSGGRSRRSSGSYSSRESGGGSSNGSGGGSSSDSGSGSDSSSSNGPNNVSGGGSNDESDSGSSNESGGGSDDDSDVSDSSNSTLTSIILDIPGSYSSMSKVLTSSTNDNGTNDVEPNVQNNCTLVPGYNATQGAGYNCSIIDNVINGSADHGNTTHPSHNQTIAGRHRRRVLLLVKLFSVQNRNCK